MLWKYLQVVCIVKEKKWKVGNKSHNLTYCSSLQPVVVYNFREVNFSSAILRLRGRLLTDCSCSAENSSPLFFIHFEIEFFDTTNYSEASLFAMPFSIWRMISHFFFKDLFVSILFTVDLFLNYHWIKTKFL